MPKKRGTRSGLRREFRVVRATALRKLRGSKDDLSKHELEVPAQQISADLDRIDGGTGTASSSHTAGATAHGCHGGHGQATHAGNPFEFSARGNQFRITMCGSKLSLNCLFAGWKNNSFDLLSSPRDFANFSFVSVIRRWSPSRVLSTGLCWGCREGEERNVFHGRSGCGRTRG